MDRVVERHHFNRAIRGFFESMDFLEVETPTLVPSPGTDVYINPIRADLTIRTETLARYLHTSPEFAMKGLLAEGYERIYQICKAYRDGESTEIHAPEFTMLEWYRAGAEVEEIIDDVESLCRELLPTCVTVDDKEVTLDGVWTRISMQSLVESACGFDVLECQEFDSLRNAVEKSVGLNPRACGDWDAIFFDLWVRFLDPVLAQMGVVFLCDWPTRLAVLSEQNPDDPRVAKRFELFIGGLEIANGFQELTDAAEQKQRFIVDNKKRAEQGREVIPLPLEFLLALETGFPRSAGVAVGVDRLLMLKTGTKNIREILNPPYF